MKDHIKITGIDLRRLVAAVYVESKPVAMDLFQNKLGPLPKNDLEVILSNFKVQGAGCVLSMDYVLGRAVKFHIFRDENQDLWVRKTWHDHTELQLRRALRDAGLKELSNANPDS